MGNNQLGDFVLLMEEQRIEAVPNVVVPHSFQSLPSLPPWYLWISALIIWKVKQKISHSDSVLVPFSELSFKWMHAFESELFYSNNWTFG